MSDSGERLLLEFEQRGVVHGGNILLPPNVALEFVRQCWARGVELLGFDAFRLLPGEQIQPIIEDSMDLSSSRFAASTTGERMKMAETFIDERLGKEIVFEMVVE